MDPQEEFTFWGRQATEHMMFLSLGLESAGVRPQAHALYQAMQASYDSGDAPRFMGLLQQALSFKRRLRARLYAGEWLGWIYPSFVDHTIREEEYFLARIAGSIAPQTEVAAWLRFMGEHAGFAGGLIDPSEKATVRAAIDKSDAFDALRGTCEAGACSGQLLTLSALRGQELDQFFSGASSTKPLSVIHPALLQHVIREGRRFVQRMGAIAQGG
jgi:hypothetical protein